CAAIWDPDSLTERREHIAEAARLVAAGGDPFMSIMVGLRRWDFGMEAADRAEADAGLAIAHRVAEEVARPTLRWQVRVRETTRALIAGRLEEATELLGEAHELGLRGEQPDAELGWLLRTTLLADVSAKLDHLESAAVLYERLRPHRGQLAIRPPGGTGSVDRHLGELAITLGRFDEAARHLRRAAALYTRLG